MHSEMQSIVDRMDCLERKNQRLRWLLVSLPVLALFLGAAADDVVDWKGKSVTTEKLILVDGDGKELGSWSGHKGAPVLEFYNKDHSLLLNAGKSPDNGVGFVQFFDENGKFKGGVGGNALK